jgi:hypothetical protein
MSASLDGILSNFELLDSALAECHDDSVDAYDAVRMIYVVTPLRSIYRPLPECVSHPPSALHLVATFSCKVRVAMLLLTALVHTLILEITRSAAADRELATADLCRRIVAS